MQLIWDGIFAPLLRIYGRVYNERVLQICQYLPKMRARKLLDSAPCASGYRPAKTSNSPEPTETFVTWTKYEAPVTYWLWLSQPIDKYNKCSAVAETGDRLVAVDVDRKVRGCYSPFFLGGGAGSPSHTMCPVPRHIFIPNGIVIHQTVWPQYTNVTDRQTG